MRLLVRSTLSAKDGSMSAVSRAGVRPSLVLLWIGVGSLIGVGLLVALLVMGAVRGGSADGREQPVVTDAAEVRVEVYDNGYRPADLTVRPGATVTWDFTGRVPHTVTAYDGSFDSDILGRGDAWSMTFDEPGKYEYYCTLHHSMQGVVVVHAS
jgi:plastocyanin